MSAEHDGQRVRESVQIMHKAIEPRRPTPNREALMKLAAAHA